MKRTARKQRLVLEFDYNHLLLPADVGGQEATRLLAILGASSLLHPEHTREGKHGTLKRRFRFASPHRQDREAALHSVADEDILPALPPKEDDAGPDDKLAMRLLGPPPAKGQP